MSKKSAERLLSGQAWDDYCDSLKVAGRLIDRFGDDPSDLERAEWYRFLSRTATCGLHRFLENGEPEGDRPRLVNPTPRGGLNVASPDQDHWFCDSINGEHEYRLSGNRGSVPYFVMISGKLTKQPPDYDGQNWAAKGFAGLEEFDSAPFETEAFLMSDQIDFDEDGRFEVIISRREHEGNWLALSDESSMVFLRVVHHDRATETPPCVGLERLDAPKPQPVRPDEVSAGLAKTGQYVLGWAEWIRTWWQDIYAGKANRIIFSDAVYGKYGGVMDRAFGFGRWNKPEGDALVIEFTPAVCEYWNFQLCTIWQENLDNYEEGQGNINKFTASYESDGSIRIVVAERNPGIGGNWLDSYAHEQGIMGLRLIKTEGAPAVTSRQVRLIELETEGVACLSKSRAIVSGEVVD